MRISDWSSDVCSSDLVTLTPEGELFAERIRPLLKQLTEAADGLAAAERPLCGSITVALTPTMTSLIGLPLLQKLRTLAPGIRLTIGRASRRERVGQYV